MQGTTRTFYVTETEVSKLYLAPIGIRTPERPACSIVATPIMLLRLQAAKRQAS